MASVGIDCDFPQDNHSRSSKGIVRGLHYQLGRPQAKLVRVICGEVLDVAVDVRRDSPTFGQWEAIHLTDAEQRMLFIPEGFAHGFQVLSDIVEFSYKCTDYYAPAEERGILWNDPNIGIAWRTDLEPILSDRDLEFPLLCDMSPDDLPTL